MDERDLEYHRARARAEIDCAYRANHHAVAEAHFRLAAMHMDRLRSEDELCGGTGLSQG